MEMYTNCSIDLSVDSWPPKRNDIKILINYNCFMIKYLFPIEVLKLACTKDETNIQSAMMGWDIKLRKVWSNMQSIGLV